MSLLPAPLQKLMLFSHSLIIFINNNKSYFGHIWIMNLLCDHPFCRIASISKIFPTLMLYRLWEDGKVGSLDDPLEKYVDNFTIKNPLGKSRDSELKYVTDGLIFLDSGEVQIRTSSVTLRRMASQLSGKFPASNLVSRSNSMIAQSLRVGITTVSDHSI